MDSIELNDRQREQMAGLISQLSTTRQIAEAFVGYFAKELGVNLQLYQFNADSFRFEPVGGYTPVTADNGLETAGPEPETSGQPSAVSRQPSRNGVP